MTTYYDRRRAARQGAAIMGVSKSVEVLSRSSPEPLYRQLSNHLERAIRSGRLKPGDRLDSETVLGRRFGVSRITLRQAVDELVGKQLLIRKQGKGTFVTIPAVQHDLRRLHGLLGSLFSQSDAAGTRLLRYELAVPPAEVAEQLKLRRGQKALAHHRIYLIGGKPVSFGQTWLVPEVAVLPRVKAEFLSTEDLMREAGVRIAASQVAIRAEPAGAKVARSLKVSARAPLLVLQRQTFGHDGRIKEINRIWFRSDSYELICSTQEGASRSLFDIRGVSERTKS
jgi:GntR family transcriptional regulator